MAAPFRLGGDPGGRRRTDAITFIRPLRGLATCLNVPQPESPGYQEQLLIFKSSSSFFPMTPTSMFPAPPCPTPSATPCSTKNKPLHILLDIEALGVRPGSAIVQLGAVAFSPHTGEIMGETFHRHILPHAQLHTELRTLHWHTERGTWPPAPPAAPVALEQALAEFSRWVEETGRPHTWWSWGSTYDFPLLDAACHVLGREGPWAYWQTACARTVWRMAFPFGKTAPRPHHALEDSIAAVKDLHQALGEIRGRSC